jgi:hypothetical protein
MMVGWESSTDGVLEDEGAAAGAAVVELELSEAPGTTAPSR